MQTKTEKFLYIIRHGETEFNRMNIVQGSGVDMDLNETGKNQALKFYNHYCTVSFDRVFTSALKRSITSVKCFIENGLPHTIIPELNEIGWGDFEGKEQSTNQKKHFFEIIDRWKKGEFNLSVKNGESPQQLQQRQKIALEIILNNNREKNILICMHGRAMKSFLCLLLGKPLSEMEDFLHSNLGLYVLKLENNYFKVMKQNDVSHLQGKD